MKFKFPNISEESGVYVFYFLKSERKFPFYVGETSNLRKRMGMYVVASFAASTDFLVGEAVKYIQEKGYCVVVEFKSVLEERLNRKKEEEQLINEFRLSGLRLLNRDRRNPGYDYRKAKREEILNKIYKEVEVILLNATNHQKFRKSRKDNR